MIAQAADYKAAADQRRTVEIWEHRFRALYRQIAAQEEELIRLRASRDKWRQRAEHCEQQIADQVDDGG